jgi:hypothetical protein
MKNEFVTRSLALYGPDEAWVAEAHDMAPRGCFKGGGGGGGTQQVVQTSDPWAGQQPHLQDIFARAQALSNVPQTFYHGSTFAGLSPESEVALQLQTQRARAGSPLTNAAQTELTRTLGGGYLDPTSNPAFQKAAGDIQSRVSGMFSAGGRYGSGAMANQANEALSSLAAQTYGQERENMMRGMMFAPQLAQQDYFDAAKLAEVGGIREDLAQQAIDEAVARHTFAQSEPWQRLALFNQMIQGNYGGQSTSITTTPRRALGAGILSGAASGAGIGSMFGPWGGLAGAGIGGLLSLFD